MRFSAATAAALAAGVSASADYYSPPSSSVCYGYNCGAPSSVPSSSKAAPSSSPSSSKAAPSSVTYTTQVVSSYVTYCPSATQLTYGGQTYTVTKPTTLTITNCPCTVTKPVTTSCSSSQAVQTVVTTSCPSSAATSAPVYTSVKSSQAPVYTAPYYNGTATVKPIGTGAYSAPATYTGAANKVVGATGAGLAAVLGLAAYVL